jgi:hypothetical protein
VLCKNQSFYKGNLIKPVLHFDALAQSEIIWIRIHVAKILRFWKVRFQNVAGKEVVFFFNNGFVLESRGRLG